MKWYFISTLRFFVFLIISMLSLSLLRLSRCAFVPSIYWFVCYFLSSVLYACSCFLFGCLIVFVLFFRIIRHSFRWKCWFSWPWFRALVLLTSFSFPLFSLRLFYSLSNFFFYISIFVCLFFCCHDLLKHLADVFFSGFHLLNSSHCQRRWTGW